MSACRRTIRSLVRRGLSAQVSVPEYPDQTFTASVVNDAQSVGRGRRHAGRAADRQSRRPPEVRRLRPGGVQAALRRNDHQGRRSTALLFKHGGPTVAVVGPDGHVKVRPVTIVRDLGPEVEIGAASARRARDRQPARGPGRRRPGARGRRWSGSGPMRKADRLLLVAAAASVLAACATAPAYVPPAVSVPTAFKETGPWTPAAPADAQARGEVVAPLYRDPVLDDLEARAARANPGLAAAVAAHDQAVALAAQARAGFFPSTSTVRRSARPPAPLGQRAPAPQRRRRTSIRPARSSRRRRSEVDLWGRVRDQVAAGTAQAQASAADLESVRLSLAGRAGRQLPGPARPRRPDQAAGRHRLGLSAGAGPDPDPP